VDLNQIRKDIRFVFDENKNRNRINNEEIALVATPVPTATQPLVPQTWTQTRTPCDICGKIGHKAIDCFTKPENAHKLAAFRARRQETPNGTNPTGIICEFCNKPYHTAANCNIKKFIDLNLDMLPDNIDVIENAKYNDFLVLQKEE
jgi:hypothetical protein